MVSHNSLKGWLNDTYWDSSNYASHPTVKECIISFKSYRTHTRLLWKPLLTDKDNRGRKWIKMPQVVCPVGWEPPRRLLCYCWFCVQGLLCQEHPSHAQASTETHISHHFDGFSGPPKSPSTHCQPSLDIDQDIGVSSWERRDKTSTF